MIFGLFFKPCCKGGTDSCLSTQDVHQETLRVQNGENGLLKVQRKVLPNQASKAVVK